MPSEKSTKKELDERYEKRIESFRIELFETLTPILSIIIPKLSQLGFTMECSLVENAIVGITEKTTNKMENTYFYRLEDDQLRYFLNIIIANLPDLIKNLDFKKEISQSNLDKLIQNKTLELEVQEQILKQVINSISNIFFNLVTYRATTIMEKNYTVAKQFPVREGRLIEDENGYYFWKPNE